MELYEFNMQFRGRWNRDVFNAVLDYVKSSRLGRVSCYGSLDNNLFFEVWDEKLGIQDLGKLLNSIFGESFSNIEIRISPYRIIRRRLDV